MPAYMNDYQKGFAHSSIDGVRRLLERSADDMKFYIQLDVTKLPEYQAVLDAIEKYKSAITKLLDARDPKNT